MQSAPHPSNEAHRLWALRQYEILDSEREALFDDVTKLAASVCDAPIALISLVDSSRQWFKACEGLEAKQTARSVAFCAHAILQPGLFVVPDAREDPRFADNPLVAGPPHIRFYAGAPLFTAEGFGLGTLCVIDTRPRALTDEQAKALQLMRNHVLKLLDIRLKARELAELNRELDAYSYAVSHDLRAPVRAVAGFAGILREDHGASLDEDALELVADIEGAARRMGRLIDDLLYLSRAVRAPISRESVDLGALAEASVARLRKAHPDDGTVVDIQPGMRVLGDARLLGLALDNLIGNAWKYSATAAEPTISIGTKAEEDEVCFFVRDNGVGFDMAYADRLFEPFSRLHGSEAFAGTGIGLTTVKRVIGRHGGRIWAESVPGRGACFYFVGAEESPCASTVKGWWLR